MTRKSPQTTNQYVLAEHEANFGTTTAHGAALLHFLEINRINGVRYEEDEHDQRIWWIHATLPKSSQEIFVTAHEVLFIYADFKSIHPRILKQISDRLAKQQRLDPDLVFIASNSETTDKMAREVNNGISIIPLHLDTLAIETQPSLKQRLEKWLPVFDRYNVTRPLRSSSDLFGRNDELTELSYLLDNGQSIGLFGLRKAGKTSVLNAIRVLRLEQKRFAIQIDLSGLANSDHFRKRIIEESWKRAEVILRSEGRSTKPLFNDRTLYTLTDGRANATVDELRLNWLDDLEQIIKMVRRPLELIVDEIDTIFPGQSSQYSPDDLEQFETVMRELRGILQNDDENHAQAVMLCAGVNPAIFESSITPNGRNNQLYKLVRLIFLKPLAADESARMVRRLGEKMGVKYDGHEPTDLLFRLFGGHPMLTRHACSTICRNRPRGEFPWRINADVVARAMEKKGIGTVYEQSREIHAQFSQWFPDEADLLGALWGPDPELRTVAAEIAASNPDLLKHAHAYGLLDGNDSARMSMVAASFRGE